MHDIRLAAALIVLVSIAVFLGTKRLLARSSPRFLDFIVVVIVILMAAYGYFVFGQLWIVAYIPLPSVPMLSNWFPPLAAALSAAVWLRLREVTVGRRRFVLFALWLAAGYSILYLAPSFPPECRNAWAPPRPPIAPYPVCLQTTPYTCSAASAATILNCLGYAASEQEMAEYCLTRSGTTWLGLYHGLACKLEGEPYRVGFFQAHASELPALSVDCPSILCCEVDEQTARLVPQLVDEGGWIPGVAHSVVYFGSLGEDRHVIGDPSRGYEMWSSRDLNLVWTGQGLSVRAVGRPPTDSRAFAR